MYNNHICGESLGNAVGVPNAEMKIVWFWLHKVYLELLEYIPQVSPSIRRNDDIGTAHFSFTVSDIHEAWRELTARGAEISAEPEQVNGGALDRHWYFYFKCPDGFQFEFTQLPPDASGIHVPA